jgi:thiol:disulfide interchange protein
MSPRHLLAAFLLTQLCLLPAVYALPEPPAPPEVPPGAMAEDAFDEGDPRVVARLLLDQTSAAPGATVRVGVLLSADPHWHVYWRYSGDAGIPTSLTWTLPPGATASPLRWPAPQTFSESGGFILTYGYAHELLVWSDITLPADASGELEIGADVAYLTCRESCIPGEGLLTRSIKIEPVARPSQAEAARFDDATAQVPIPIAERRMSAALAIAGWVDPGQTMDATLTFDLCASPGDDCAPLELDPASAALTHHAFIPDHADKIVWRPQRVTVNAAREVVVALKGKISPDADAATLEAARVGGVLRLKGADGRASHLEVSLPLKGAALHALAAPAAEPVALATTAAPAAPPAQELGLVWVLLLAFCGGLLLNFMPCVFPVLSLKLAMLARMSGHARGHMVRHGLAYAAGIAAAMLALALVVLGLRAAGEQVGWGFQFQNPWFLVFLSAVVAVFTSNLLGAFEISTPQVGGISGLPEEGLGQSFAEGLLCVLLATPCSAPFMGTAVGFALASDAPTLIAILQALGLGLAAPFVLLCAAPGWQRLLPKPGPWFDQLRHGLAFALLATLVWILWVFGQTQGTDGMARLMGFLVALVMAAWVWGIVQYSTNKRRAIGALIAVAIAGGAGWAMLSVKAQDAQGAPQAALDEGWRAYDEDAIKAELAAGHPVFVDFTADWCISCKVNEHGALESAQVRAAFTDLKVVKFKADWTRRDERIRAILARFGKAGVPMYLVYSPARPDQPEVLPELLSATIVTDALDRAR